MPSPIMGQKILQVQLDNNKVEMLDEIQRRTYVPRSTLIRMALDRFLVDVQEGKVAMGIASVGPLAPGSHGPQASFTVVQPPPPPPGSGENK